MTSDLEYHEQVRGSITASVALLGLFVSPIVLVVAGSAQVNGVASAPTAAVGRASMGTVPSVTGAVHPPTGAVGPPTGTVPNAGPGVPRGFTSGLPISVPSTPAHNNGFIGTNNRHHQQQHHHYIPYAPPVVYGMVLPYAIDIGDAEESDNPGADEDAGYQGGPTVFDRRGSGADSYVPPVDDDSTSDDAERAYDEAPDPGPPDPTLLVFRDGHKLEVGNYAIVGVTLFDMTPGHARKVPLADLDLEATRQQNEDRGVTFQVPSISSQAN